VHQQQPADNCVKGLSICEGTGVALAKHDIVRARFGQPDLRSGNLNRILFDSDNRTLRSNDSGHLEGNVTRAGAQIQDPHSQSQPSTRQKRTGRFSEQGRLCL
jgi:hypothetical protein